MLELSKVGEDRRRWIPLSVWADVEVEIRFSGPKEQEKFRQRLLHKGILKQSGSGTEVAPGRWDDFFLAYAQQHVTGWRGPIYLNAGDAETAPYSPEEMAKVFSASTKTFTEVTTAVAEEADFFSSSGDASTN